MYLGGERRSRYELFVKGDVNDMVYPLEWYKTDDKLGRSLRMHLGGDVAPAGRYCDLQVTFAGLACIDGEVNGFTDGTPRNGGNHDFRGIVCFA